MDIQRIKRTITVGELGLGYNDRHLKVLFEMSSCNSGILVEIPKALADIQWKTRACFVRYDSAS